MGNAIRNLDILKLDIKLISNGYPALFLVNSLMCVINLELHLKRWRKASMLHKSHNELKKYPTMPRFVTEMCTRVHVSITKWHIVGYKTGALLDTWLVHC